ncbi:hypothetical protein J5751_06370 [bacterium]|nr:hypothetical protein [bacterium]
MECKCKKCWYVVSAILLIVLLAINVLLYVRQTKYLNFSIAQAGGIENWEKIQKIYNSDKWKEEQTSSIDAYIAQFKAQYGNDENNNSDTTSSETNADVANIVEDLLASAPVRGDKNARFTIIEYTELLCPYCQRHSENGTIETVMEKFP